MTSTGLEGDRLRIGGLDLDREQARDAAAAYLSGEGEYGYPAYDAFDAGGGPWRLTDGDLLAPGLLNVPVRLPAFYSLTAIRPQLEAWLREVPSDARLVDASMADLDRLATLFKLVDEGIPGVGAVTLAKIMHRKRPSFVPLYDKFIWQAYVGTEDPPVVRVKNRTWAQFIPLLANAMQSDLRRESDWLWAVAGHASGVAITPLRVLDIVAWSGARRLARSGNLQDPPEEDI